MSAAGIRARAVAVEEARKKSVQAAGRDLKRTITARAIRDTGGDQRLSGLGSAAGKLDVRARTQQGGTTTTVIVDAAPKRMRGPWRWMNDGVDAGTRRNRVRSTLAPGRRTGRAGRARGAPYRHPGQAAKGTFDEPVNEQMPKIRAEFRSGFRSAIQRGG